MKKLILFSACALALGAGLTGCSKPQVIEVPVPGPTVTLTPAPDDTQAVLCQAALADEQLVSELLREGYGLAADSVEAAWDRDDIKLNQLTDKITSLRTQRLEPAVKTATESAEECNS